MDDLAGETGPRPYVGRGLGKAQAYVMYALLAAAPLLLGTVHPATRALVFGGCMAALVLTILERRRVKHPVVPSSAPLWALAVLVAATALQLVPLPANILAWLSPAADDLLATAIGDYGWHPLSLDPAATTAELAKLGAYLAFFIVAASYARRSRRRQRLVIAVAAIAAIEAVIALVELSLDTKKVLFFYTPQDDWAGHFRGTLVNSNHFGALMCLGAPCALWIGLNEARWRGAALVALLAINVAALLTSSRGTMIMVPMAQVVIFVVERSRRRRVIGGAREPWLLFAAATAAVVVATAFAIRGELWFKVTATRANELSHPFTSLSSKFQPWAFGAELVRHYPWVGAGRGSFGLAVTRFATHSTLRYPWVENAYLQAACDWGLIVLGVLVALGVATLVTAVRRLRDEPLAIPAIVGLGALAVHEAADFATEIPGVALPALALLAALVGQRPSARARNGMAVASLAIVPLLIGGALAMSVRTSEASEDRTKLTTAVHDPGVSTAEVLARAEVVRRRHPADSYMFAIVAERLVRARHPDAMRWLNSAIYLNPSFAPPHLMVAELLAVSGRKSQALLEYRFAAAGGASVWDRVAARYPDLDDLLSATPEAPERLDALAAWLTAHRRHEDAERTLELAVARDPTNADRRRQLVTVAIDRHDVVQAERRIAALRRVDDSPESRRMAVRVLLLAGHLDAASHLLEATFDQSRACFTLVLDLASACLEGGALGTARKWLDRLTWTEERTLQARLHDVRARLERLSGNEHQARWEQEEAARLRER